jgi:WD40 repeat protein
MKAYHHLHQTDEYSHKLPGAISRRRFIALAIATFVTGCASSSQSTSHPPGKSATPLTSTPTTILPPRERINPGNASRVVQLARLDPGDVEVKSIAWSPDAGLFAAGAYNDIQFWNPKTGKAVAILRGHRGLIWSIAWAPNGHLLASASDDGTLRIWDAGKYTVLNILRAHSDMVLSVGWSPDGSRLITGNIDGTLELWDTSNRKNLAVWKGHAPENSGKSGIWALAVFAAAWSPDGRRIASTREDNIVQLWEAKTGKVLNVLLTNQGSANIVAWSPDGRLLAVTNDIGSVQLWDAQTGKNVALLQGHPEAGWANAVTWSPDGSMLASTREEGTVQLWDAKLGKELAALQGHKTEVWGAAWSPDGFRIVSGSKDATIRLWGVP